MRFDVLDESRNRVIERRADVAQAFHHRGVVFVGVHVPHEARRHRHKSAAALAQVDAAGSADEQTEALRNAMRVLFPEAVALVSAARQGFMRET